MTTSSWIQIVQLARSPKISQIRTPKNSFLDQKANKKVPLGQTKMILCINNYNLVWIEKKSCSVYSLTHAASMHVLLSGRTRCCPSQFSSVDQALIGPVPTYYYMTKVGCQTSLNESSVVTDVSYTRTLCDSWDNLYAVSYLTAIFL